MRYDVPSTPDFWRGIAAAIVLYALFKSVITPLLALFAGTLWGPSAFMCGAYIVASLMFGEMYFRDEEDVYV